MNEPKTFASLGPTLLARKGGARPAMRPQLAPLSALGGAQAADSLAHDLEDLGWNDMGTHEAPDEVTREAQVFSLTPAPAGPSTDVKARRPVAVPEAVPTPVVPEVLRQRRVVAAEVASPVRDHAAAPVARPEPVERQAPAKAQAVARSAARPRRNALDAGRRAAFTLRLDERRHLMLRLASTVKNRSAQQLVTAALDEFLAGIPEIETLAAQVKRDRTDR